MPSTPSSPPVGRPDRPIVDAHVHLLPDRVLEAIREWFHRETSWTLPAVTGEEVVDFLAALDGAVCFPYAHKPGVARSMNRTVADAVADLNSVVGLATVHAGDDDIAGVLRDGFDRGLGGVKLHCPVQGFPPDDRRLDPVYELAVDRDLPVVIHASSHPFYRDAPVVGPGPTERVLERFPDLRLCVPHLGLFEADAFLDLAARYDGLAFDTAVAVGEAVHDLIGLRDGEFPLERLRNRSDRVMFGSDYPTYPGSIAYRDMIAATARTFPEDHEAVFYRNAVDFFDVSPPRR